MTTFQYVATDPFADPGFFRECRALYVAGGLVLAGGTDATQTKTFAESADAGHTWAYLTVDPFGAGEGMAVVYNGSRIIGGSNRPTNPLKYSDDGGATWNTPAHQFQNTTGPRTGVRALAYGSGSTVWSGGYGVPSTVQPDGVAVSTDGGATWSDPSPNPFAYTGGTNAFCFDICVSGATILAVGLDGSLNSIAYSTNGGTTWTHLAEAFNNTDTEACFISGSRLLVGGFPSVNYPALKYSDDGGATWTNPTFTGATTVFGCPRIAKIGTQLWASLNTDVGSGLLATSDDNGTTWNLLSSQPFSSPTGNTDTWAIVSSGSTVIVGGNSSDLHHTIAYSGASTWTIGRVCF